MFFDVFGIFFFSKMTQVEFHYETKGDKKMEKKIIFDFLRKCSTQIFNNKTKTYNVKKIKQMTVERTISPI